MSVQVLIRFRPSSAVSEALKVTSTTVLRTDKLGAEPMVFDKVYLPESKCGDVTEFHRVLNGFQHGISGTIFAYGQTGSGKTHTMLNLQPDDLGIVPRCLKILCESGDGIVCSFVEIYGDSIYDLLHPGGNPLELNLQSEVRETDHLGRPLRAKSRQFEPRLQIQGCESAHVNSYEGALGVLHAGLKNRHTASTLMNRDSSRSHTLFMIRHASTYDATLFLVDLAGSEQVKKSGVTGKQFQEACDINKSLSALSNVIKQLTTQQSHIAYRDSKLTRILKDSLGGTARTLIILAASLDPAHYAETVQTLMFGVRAKKIKNRETVRIIPGESKADYFKDLYHKALDLLQSNNIPIPWLEGSAPPPPPPPTRSEPLVVEPVQETSFDLLKKWGYVKKGDFFISPISSFPSHSSSGGYDTDVG